MILDLTNKVYYKIVELDIYKSIYLAFFSYLLPFLFLSIFIFDQITFQTTEMVFWVLFLVSLIPCGLLGIAACTYALIYSFKDNSKINKIISAIGLFVGLCGISGGLLGVLLIYLVVS